MSRGRTLILSLGLGMVLLLALLGCAAATPTQPPMTFSVPTSTPAPLGDVYTVTTGTLAQSLELRG